MRLQGITELNITTHTLEGSLKEVRAQLEKVNFDDGITVLALQPEVGKTYTFLRYCEANPDKNIGYFSPDHTLLDEVESELRQKLPCANIIHWEGVKKSCQEYLNENPYVCKWIDNNLPISRFFCGVGYCDYAGECQYENQFNYSKPAIVLAPSDYIGTHYVQDFDIIFIDEFLIKCNGYSWTLKDDDVKESSLLMDDIEGVNKGIIFDFSKVPDNPEKLNEMDIDLLEPPAKWM